jgi:lipopolysaccharide transport system permease protein
MTGSHHHHQVGQHPLWHLDDDSVRHQIRFAWRMRRVWWFTATARTTARFVRTRLGSLWLGLTNMLTIAALSLVYGTVFRVDNFKEYAVYLGVGLVLWNAVASAIGTSPKLFEQNRSSLNNINLPPLFYVLEEWAFQLQTLFQSVLIVLLCLSFIQPLLLLRFFTVSLPALLNLVLYMFWVPLLVCLMGARFKDFYQLVPIALQLVFLLSPVIYMRSSLGTYAWLAYLNPIYPSISILRDSLITGHPLIQPSAIFLLVNSAGCYFSLWLLRRETRILPFLF